MNEMKKEDLKRGVFCYAIFKSGVEEVTNAGVCWFTSSLVDMLRLVLMYPSFSQRQRY